MLRPVLLATLIAAGPTAAIVGVADTSLALRAFPLEVDPGDGTLVTVLQITYSWRTDGIATGPTEVSLDVAERPPGIEAAVVPDHVSIPVPLEATAASRREAPPEHVALVIRISPEAEDGSHLAVLAYARPNGNLKASSATLRLPLEILTPGAPATTPAPLEVEEALPPEPISVPSSALWTGAAVGAAAGFLLLSFRLRRR